MEERFRKALEPWKDAEWEEFKTKLPKVVFEDMEEIAFKNDMTLHELIAVAVLYWWED
jgi:hypothetical protein